MIRPSKGQTNAPHPGFFQRPPVRDRPQGPPLRAGGGPAVPLRAGAGCRQQRPAAGTRRADGSFAREPRPLAASARPARALLRGAPEDPAGHQAPRCQGGGEGSETAPERDRGSPDASALTEVEMGRLFAVEIVYRGIFQKKLAANIGRALVLG